MQLHHYSPVPDFLSSIILNWVALSTFPFSDELWNKDWVCSLTDLYKLLCFLCHKLDFRLTASHWNVYLAYFLHWNLVQAKLANTVSTVSHTLWHAPSRQRWKPRSISHWETEAKNASDFFLIVLVNFL